VSKHDIIDIVAKAIIATAAVIAVYMTVKI